MLWRNLRALPRQTTRATSQTVFGKPCLHLLGASFFDRLAKAHNIYVLHPKCACDAAGARASLARPSDRAADIEWLQSGDSRVAGQPSNALPRSVPALSNALRGAARRRQLVAATAMARCLRQRKLAKGITCHAPSQGSFASHCFSNAGNKASCCSRLKWLSLCSQAWYRNSSSKVTALACIFLATWRAGGGYKYIARLEHLYNLLTKCCNLPYKWC